MEFGYERTASPYFYKDWSPTFEASSIHLRIIYQLLRPTYLSLTQAEFVPFSLGLDFLSCLMLFLDWFSGSNLKNSFLILVSGHGIDHWATQPKNIPHTSGSNKLYRFNYLCFKWSLERQIREAVWTDIPPSSSYLSCITNAYMVMGNVTHQFNAEPSNWLQTRNSAFSKITIIEIDLKTDY